MLGQPVIAELPAAILRPTAAAVPSNEILLLLARPQAGSLLPGARQGVSEGEERERLLLRGLPVLLQPLRPKLQVSQTVHVMMFIVKHLKRRGPIRSKTFVTIKFSTRVGI